MRKSLSDIYNGGNIYEVLINNDIPIEEKARIISLSLSQLIEDNGSGDKSRPNGGFELLDDNPERLNKILKSMKIFLDISSIQNAGKNSEGLEKAYKYLKTSIRVAGDYSGIATLINSYLDAWEAWDTYNKNPSEILKEKMHGKLLKAGWDTTVFIGTNALLGGVAGKIFGKTAFRIERRFLIKKLGRKGAKRFGHKLTKVLGKIIASDRGISVGNEIYTIAKRSKDIIKYLSKNKQKYQIRYNNYGHPQHHDYPSKTKSTNGNYLELRNGSSEPNSNSYIKPLKKGTIKDDSKYLKFGFGGGSEFFEKGKISRISSSSKLNNRGNTQNLLPIPLNQRVVKLSSSLNSKGRKIPRLSNSGYLSLGGDLEYLEKGKISRVSSSPKLNNRGNTPKLLPIPLNQRVVKLSSSLNSKGRKIPRFSNSEYSSFGFGINSGVLEEENKLGIKKPMLKKSLNSMTEDLIFNHDEPMKSSDEKKVNIVVNYSSNNYGGGNSKGVPQEEIYESVLRALNEEERNRRRVEIA